MDQEALPPRTRRLQIGTVSPAISRLLAMALPFRWLIAGATVCGLLKFNLPLVFPWFLKDIINLLVTPSPAHFSRINILIISITLVYLFWAVVTYLRTFLTGRLEQHLIFNLRQEFYTHLQRMSLSFFEKRQVGTIASRLFGDVSIAQNLIGGAFTNTLMDLSSLLIISCILFLMNVPLACVSLAIFPLYVYANRFFKTRLRTSSRLAQETLEKMAGRATEKLGGMPIIQSFTHEENEKQTFFVAHRHYLRQRLINVRNNAMATAAIGFLTSIAPVLVVWYGARAVVHGELSIGELTAFYAYLGMFYQPLNRLTELNIQIANATAALDRIFEILSMTPEIEDNTGAQPVGTLRGDICFSDVHFAYDPRQLILNAINASITAGQTVALVGESGAGKSTFAKLIPRFYDVTVGSITIDGRDIRTLCLHDLRRNIALVPQDPILFSGTILENLLLGRPEASETEIHAAACQANAHEFIMQLPLGYQTEIGEKGYLLSGGQRQRIAIARAFLKNAPILILDEATSMLDAHTERQVREALERLTRGRTTLIIAHRIATVQRADRIFVFRQGTIVEAGTHAELRRIDGGVYQSLCQAQFGMSLP